MVFERQMDGSKIGYTDNGLSYLCGSDGKKIFSKPFEELKHKFSRFYMGKRDGKWALLDTTGRVITPFKYNQIIWMESDLFLCFSDAWTLLNSQNIDLLKEEFPCLISLSIGMAIFMKNNEYIFTNGYGQITTRVEFFNKDAEFNGADLALIETRDGKKGLLKKNGEWYVEPITPHLA
jgi:hypothetical protein